MKSFLRSVYYRIRGLPEIDRGGVKGEHLVDVVAKDDPLILEIGANDGEHTEWMLKLFPRATLHCFEPEPRAAQRFRARIGARPGVHLHDFALGAYDGYAEFHRSSTGSAASDQSPPGWDGSGSLRKPTGHLQRHPEISFHSKMNVPVYRFDTWARNAGLAGVVDLIWMDVQGAERDVFLGAGKWLGRIRNIYTEYSNVELYEGQATLAQLRRMLPDFSVARLYPDDVLFVRKAKLQEFASELT